MVKTQFYYTLNFFLLYSIKYVHVIGGEQELGCYVYINNWGEKITEENLTIEKCLGYCRERSLPLAALFGSHNVCRCRDKLPAESLKRDEEECDDSCIGDLENEGGCGGNNRMNVYFVTGMQTLPNQNANNS